MNRAAGNTKLNFKIYLESLIHLFNFYFYKMKGGPRKIF